MDWHLAVFEVIDMRSFSNLWFWIALAVMWSTTSHWVLGVPFDMVARAKRHGGQAAVDLEDLARINANRILFIAHEAGLWILALACFLLTGLMVLGFFYDVEFAQAVFLLAFPMSLIALMSVRTALRIRNDANAGEALWRRLAIHRVLTQLMGMISIFVTALWGMYQNLSIGALGG
ncbi:MAG: component of SufBCD complex [Rhodobacteraceae bacterium]|nr:component of SufBCD complex [Paracoccaceae bacterium]